MRRILGNWYGREEVSEREDKPEKRTGESLEIEERKEKPGMADVNTSLQEAVALDGAIAAALVDWQSGMTLGTAGGGDLDLDVAAAGSTEVVRAKLKVIDNLGLDDKIEDILITLSSQYHLIRVLEKDTSLFLYVALNKEQANLAMARYKLTQIERTLSV